MKHVVLTEPGRLEVSQVEYPAEPGFGQVLVRIVAAGICGTDMHAFRGKQPFFSYPRVLGHELGVEVAAVGPGVSRVKPGDRCAVEPYLNCGHCIACRRGKSNCCVKLSVMGVHVDGGFGEYLQLPAEKLHVSSQLTFEQLALVETLGIGAHAVNRAGTIGGEWALVIGSGPIGLGVMQFAKAAGARVIAMDMNPARLDFCRGQIGVEAVVPAGEKAAAELADITGGDMPTAVFDATGHAGSMMGAFNLTASGGTLVFVGLFRGDVTFSDPEFHRRELTLLASRNSTAADFSRIIDLVERGLVDTRPWVTHRASLWELPGKMPEWIDPSAGVIKAVVSVSTDGGSRPAGEFARIEKLNPTD